MVASPVSKKYYRIIKIPPDGFCFYHCYLAGTRPEWHSVQRHEETGYATQRDILQKEEDEVKKLRKSVCEKAKEHHESQANIEDLEAKSNSNSNNNNNQSTATTTIVAVCCILCIWSAVTEKAQADPKVFVDMADLVCRLMEVRVRIVLNPDLPPYIAEHYPQTGLYGLPNRDKVDYTVLFSWTENSGHFDLLREDPNGSIPG